MIDVFFRIKVCEICFFKEINNINNQLFSVILSHNFLNYVL